jgi:hypothetical protein
MRAVDAELTEESKPMSTEADFKLLQAAAKAAGIAVRKSGGMLFVDVSRPNGVVTGREWNPLTDSGDALELAVRLRMDISWTRDARDRVVATIPGAAEAGANSANDPMAAVRGSIVRAAAAISEGEQK